MSHPLQRSRKRAIIERTVESILFVPAMITVGTTIGIIWVLGTEAFAFFQEVPLWDFLTDTQWTPLIGSEHHFGVMVLLSATVLTSLGAMLVALPLGLGSAVYLHSYASPKTRNTVKPVIEILAGIPTVVYGYFALMFVTVNLQKVFPELNLFNAFSASIGIGLLITPMISSMSVDAMERVPRELIMGAYALGVRRYQVVIKAIIPAALSGIMSSFILALSRALGETMIVTIAAGQSPNLTLNPFVAIETMTAYIVQVSMGDARHGSTAYNSLFAVAATLFLLTLVLNLIAQFLRERYQEVYH